MKKYLLSVLVLRSSLLVVTMVPVIRLLPKIPPRANRRTFLLFLRRAWRVPKANWLLAVVSRNLHLNRKKRPLQVMPKVRFRPSFKKAIKNPVRLF